MHPRTQANGLDPQCFQRVVVAQDLLFRKRDQRDENRSHIGGEDMEIKFVGDWVIDFRLRTAYRRLRSGGYIKRQSNGDVTFMWSLPSYLDEVEGRYRAAILAGAEKRRSTAS